jgi:hypothetical protein
MKIENKKKKTFPFFTDNNKRNFKVGVLKGAICLTVVLFSMLFFKAVTNFNPDTSYNMSKKLVLLENNRLPANCSEHLMKRCLPLLNRARKHT